ncbi:MAG: A/G-specific adenine glycosylase [Nitrospirota bacterium]|nr:A/G-specific adenine glycosylase [Nitrospirota bacterium]
MENTRESASGISPAVSREISVALLAWYRVHRRDLPWRRSSDPYAIWVSEVMLQQTRVETVIPYWQRFLARFPDVVALAAAPLDDVLKLWEGLGYYSRARNLHRAAGVVVAEHGGCLPDTVAGLRTLPGIGPYMAGAVASIAFGRAEPLLDGNVERVLCRLFAIGEPARQPETRRHLWRVAADLVPAEASGDFNQSMMELGATVCFPREPRCVTCPVSHLCLARSGGEPEHYPVLLKRPPTPHHPIAVAVVADAAGRLLLVRRPDSGLLGGLWEFPGGRCHADEPPEAGVVARLAERFTLHIVPVAAPPLTPVRHVFTHRRVTLFPFICAIHPAHAGIVTPKFHVEHRWVALPDVGQFALPRAHQKIVAQLSASGFAASRPSVPNRFEGVA